MDERILSLERAAASDPSNIALQVDLARAYARHGWDKPTRAAREFMAYLERRDWTVQGGADWVERRLRAAPGDAIALLGVSLTLGSEAVKKRAAWVLPQVDRAAAFPVLIGMFRETGDPELRRTLASVLNRFRELADEESRALVRAVQDDPEGIELLAPLFARSEGLLYNPALPFDQLAGSKSESIRAAAARSIPLSAGLNVLLHFMRDRAEHVRFTAARRWILAGGSPRALFDRQDLAEDVRFEALVCATDAGDHDEALRRVLERIIAEPRLALSSHQRACQALAAFGDERALEHLMAQPKNNPARNINVIRALSRFTRWRERVLAFIDQLELARYGGRNARSWARARLAGEPIDEGPARWFLRGFDQRISDPNLAFFEDRQHWR